VFGYLLLVKDRGRGSSSTYLSWVWEGKFQILDRGEEEREVKLNFILVYSL
jgi:hypothetical protein